jgi:CxxC motif-containing protein
VSGMKEKGINKKKKEPDVVFTTPTKQYICLTCPNCCELMTDGHQVSGAKCEKGRDFACQEWQEPRRMVTTTIRVETGQGTHIVPVKTATPVPLARLSIIMKAIKALRLREVPPLGERIVVPEDRESEPLEIVITGG